MVLRIDVGCLVFSRFDLFSLQFNDLGNQISNSLAEELIRIPWAHYAWLADLNWSLRFKTCMPIFLFNRAPAPILHAKL